MRKTTVIVLKKRVKIKKIYNVLKKYPLIRKLFIKNIVITVAAMSTLRKKNDIDVH